MSPAQKANAESDRPYLNQTKLTTMKKEQELFDLISNAYDGHSGLFKSVHIIDNTFRLEDDVFIDDRSPDTFVIYTSFGHYFKSELRVDKHGSDYYYFDGGETFDYQGFKPLTVDEAIEIIKNIEHGA
jgi:hypothetical protein